METADKPTAPARRVAFFGGSFDPPHLGHLAVARAARAALELDTVLFAPVGAQPLKTQGSTASFEDRVRMTRLAIAGEPGFEVSLADAPKSSGEPNYTLETLEALRRKLGEEVLLFFLIGEDSFLGLRKWHRAAEIPFAAPLIVASRPGQKLDGVKDALPPGLAMNSATVRDETRNGVEVRTFLITNQVGERAMFYLLPGLDVRISASEIREGIREDLHASMRTEMENASHELVPRGVAEYVLAHGLYR
jgi:nicotinate-nucleotide adenylyltransferase